MCRLRTRILLLVGLVFRGFGLIGLLAVPPLDGFVMNRVLGDYFETLLYKIFVSIDEHTTIAEVNDLQLLITTLVSIFIACEYFTNRFTTSAGKSLYNVCLLNSFMLSQNAVSVFCRLGFAHKRTTGLEQTALHISWADYKRFIHLLTSVIFIFVVAQHFHQQFLMAQQQMQQQHWMHHRLG
jgi:hypothetical protein